MGVASAGRSTPGSAPSTILAVAMAAPVLPAVTKPAASALAHQLEPHAHGAVLLGADRVRRLLLHADAFRGMVDDDGQVFVFQVFVQKIAQLRLRPNQVDPHGQSLAGEDRPANLRLGSFVGAYGVKRNIDEHGRGNLLGCFLDVQHGAALVLAALGAGAMGQLLLVAGGALGDAHGGQKVVRAAKCGAARRVAPFRIRHDKNSFRFSARFGSVSAGFRPCNTLAAFRRGLAAPSNDPDVLGAYLLGLDPAAETGQRLPAGVARTLIAGAGWLLRFCTAARAKSLAVRLAQRSDRQGQKHLLAQHILKHKTVSLIITDFGLRRSNGAFGGVGIGRRGAEDEVKIGCQGNLHRLDAAGAGNLEVAGKAALEPDVGHDVLGPAVLVQHLGMARAASGPCCSASSPRSTAPGASSRSKSIGSFSNSTTLKIIRLSLRRGLTDVNPDGSQKCLSAQDSRLRSNGDRE